jgi:putative YphP/YqiW family bacilliredoxin
MYPAELVKPMREELTNIGFDELFTSEDVTNALAKSGTYIGSGKFRLWLCCC